MTYIEAALARFCVSYGFPMYVGDKKVEFVKTFGEERSRLFIAGMKVAWRKWAWFIDYGYGGVQAVRYAGCSGESEPFGARRYSRPELIRLLDACTIAKSIKKGSY